MNSLLDIESFLEFKKVLSRLEDDIPYNGDMEDSTEEEKEEVRKNTYDKVISLFKEYIDWLIEEHEPDRKHQVLYIRKSYELLWGDGVSGIRIDRLLSEKRGRGNLWKEFKKMYEEKIKK